MASATVNVCAAALAFSLCSAGALKGPAWHYQDVSVGGGGRYSSLRIDKFGNAHVSYIDDAQHELKYGLWDHSLNKWFTETLDMSGGFCSLVLDSRQYPHISYDDYGSGRMKYIHWNGTNWTKETLQINAKEIAYYTSIALDSKDRPRISFYDYWGTGDNYLLHLREVQWTGEYWAVRTIDPTPGSGKFNSLAIDSHGIPHVAYADVASENASLRYATWNGTRWITEILEGAGPMNAPVFSVALELDKYDAPHIVYTDVRRHIVKYATQQNGTWTIQPVAQLVKEAYPDRNGIALDDDGRPYLSYYDQGRGQLSIAYRNGGRWTSEVVADNFAGLNSSLQIARGSLWLTYADETGRGLKFAHRELEFGGSATSAGLVRDERTTGLTK